jgi:pyrimidine-nucleoside phosphorylase
LYFARARSSNAHLCCLDAYRDIVLTMRAVDIITRKRDGHALTKAEIDFFIKGYVEGGIPDYQAAAWAMAVLLKGMTPEETAYLTQAMAFSGDSLDLHDVAPLIVDKHSSGGVGDKTTLVVGPMVASLGVPVGKMSGRGLSFSGGTLDKLESIPGFRTDLTIEEFKRQLAEVGLVVSGQTQELAPADGKLYALRDVTGTVPSPPLIASSIMSKKIAAGADAIVLDVKAGKGAFVETVPEAVQLAELMVSIGRQLGRRMAAVIGDMSQPLGLAVGNALEVAEAIATLRGDGPDDFRQHCIDIAGEMLLIAGVAPDPEAALAMAEQSLADGSAWRKFREFVAAQRGDLSSVDDPSCLPGAPLVEPLTAEQSGYIAGLDAREVGFAVVELGGGRARKGEPIDPAVGVVLSEKAKVGSYVEVGEPLMWIHAREGESLAAAKSRLQAAISFSDRPVEPPPWVHAVLRPLPGNSVGDPPIASEPEPDQSATVDRSGDAEALAS